MTKQEKRVLAKIVQSLKGASAPGSAYDANMRPIKVEELVPGTPNHQLLDNEFFKAGYRRCWEEFVSYLAMLDASKADQIKFAGRAK